MYKINNFLIFLIIKEFSSVTSSELFYCNNIYNKIDKLSIYSLWREKTYE